MNISDIGIALIKQFEGFSATPYLCPAGKWTVGYGHVLTPPYGGAGSPAGTGPRNKCGDITEEQAHQLLLNDLTPMLAALNRLIAAPISQNQFDALASFIYNIGIGAFAGSTLLRMLNAGEAGVEKEFLRWIYAAKTPLPGLIRRRKAEMELFLTAMPSQE